MGDVFVVRTTDLRKSDFIVSTQLTFWFLLNVLVILYLMYLYEDCDLSSMVRIAIKRGWACLEC